MPILIFHVIHAVLFQYGHKSVWLLLTQCLIYTAVTVTDYACVVQVILTERVPEELQCSLYLHTPRANVSVFLALGTWSHICLAHGLTLGRNLKGLHSPAQTLCDTQ